MACYFIWTIGCQMNKAESRQIAGYLSSAGYEAAGALEEADIVVLNTCVVRQSAEEKALGTIGLAKGLKEKRPGMAILVTGCFVGSDIAGLQRRFPWVDLFFRPGDYSTLENWAQSHGISVDGWKRSVPLLSPPTAFIPIIQGCNNFCSYCIVPYRRGREVSRPVEEVVGEVRQIVEHGVREVTLLGQNVDSYGHDLPGSPDLADLLVKLNAIDGLWRIRFLTNHPKDMSVKLIQTMATLDKVCEHLDLAVQAGDDQVLQAMRRGYTVEQFHHLVHTIRRYMPGISLSTDVIVGFPGETEEQFEHTLSLLEELRFDVVHVAAYSPRPGTIAWREGKDDVSREAKRARFDKVEQLQQRVASEINAKIRGDLVEVLVEGRKKGKWYGRNRNDKLVFFKHNVSQLEHLVKVRIDRTSPWALQGEMIGNGDGNRD
ncbi:MAG: tRNA (N6-isopentenyl adenosine(37)-C2)-methylthiotransferase MiaB [Dehalococcoidia bacterium]|nr:tRNA (N6-isopentenyl adenosine(37)-C2)-methylthiotransferase MiaB [Dehalococcoidia bacterium]